MKISFKIILMSSCYESHKWIERNRSKGIRWMVKNLLEFKSKWMHKGCACFMTNINYVLENYLSRATLEEEERDVLMDLFYEIKRLYDKALVDDFDTDAQRKQFHISTKKEVLDLLDKYEIDDVFAD